MNWIKVEDQMPKKECLAIGYQNEIIIGYIGKDAGGQFFCENDHEMLDKVTHWMPLPEPPTNF